jgi:hypothetical protein
VRFFYRFPSLCWQGQKIKTAEAVIAMKCRDERNRYHCLNGRELS